MKMRASKVVQGAPLQILAQDGRDLSSCEGFSGGRDSSQSNCVGFKACEPRRDLHQSGTVARVETAAGPC